MGAAPHLACSPVGPSPGSFHLWAPSLGLLTFGPLTWLVLAVGSPTWLVATVGPSPGLFTCGSLTWFVLPVGPSPELAPPVGPVGHGEAPCLQLLDVHGQEVG